MAVGVELGVKVGVEVGVEVPTAAATVMDTALDRRPPNVAVTKVVLAPTALSSPVVVNGLLSMVATAITLEVQVTSFVMSAVLSSS